MTPDVSVVVPTYDRAHTLGASLASLFAQTGVALEVIVVDDGSTDGTRALLAACDDPRLRVEHAAHGGIAAARNRGLAAARAPVIAFHDSDDLALPGRLSRPVEYLRRHPEIDVVVQNGRMLPPEDGNGAEVPWIAPVVAHRLAGRPFGVEAVFRWNLGQLQGMCFTRRSLDATGPLDGAFAVLDDLDLVLRVTARFRAVFLDVPAFAYRRHAGGVARDRIAVREESIRVADKLVRECPEALRVIGRQAFARRQARRWGRLARMRAAAGDVAGARDALAEARARRPLHLGLALRALALGWRRG
jgi:glycosyltransferase involved in cell wall biosynthesis